MKKRYNPNKQVIPAIGIGRQLKMLNASMATDPSSSRTSGPGAELESSPEKLLR